MKENSEKLCIFVCGTGLRLITSGDKAVLL